MKKITCLFVFTCLLTIGVNAQGAPVIDLAHIIESIRNGFVMYEQLQSTIQQLKYTYESAQYQLRQIQQLDPSKISGFRDAISFVDKNLTFMRNTENNLKNFRVKIGNGSYDLLSLYKIPGGLLQEQASFWTREMTSEEKKRAWQYWGLDPRNYDYTVTWQGRIQEGAQKLASLAGSIEEHMEANDKEVQQLTDEAVMQEGTVALLQSSILMQEKLYRQLSMMSYSLNTVGNMVGDMAMGSVYLVPEMQISQDFFEQQHEDIDKLKIKGDQQ